MLETKQIRFQRRVENYFVSKFRPDFNEVDSYQVVWNGHYVKYFERARLELCRDLGVTIKGLSELGVFFPVYKYEVVMKRPIFLEDEMEVAVRPIVKDYASFEFKQLILVNNEVRVVGTIQQVLMDKKTGSILLETPKDIQDYLQPLSKEFYAREELFYPIESNAI